MIPKQEENEELEEQEEQEEEVFQKNNRECFSPPARMFDPPRRQTLCKDDRESNIAPRNWYVVTTLPVDQRTACQCIADSGV